MLPIKAKTYDPSVRIRFPRAVLRDLDKAARESGRSRNTEIIYRLSESFREQPAVAHAD